MKDEADCVIDPLVITECMVTAFVGNDPDTGENAALKGPVDGPRKGLEVKREELDVRRGYVVEKKDKTEVINNVGE